MAPDGTNGSKSAERTGGDRRNASLPRGGKLLTGEQTVRLATLENVDRDTLIARIVDRLRVVQRAKDARARTLNRKRWGK